jgi:hypothetical protein
MVVREGIVGELSLSLSLFGGGGVGGGGKIKGKEMWVVGGETVASSHRLDWVVQGVRMDGSRLLDGNIDDELPSCCWLPGCGEYEYEAMSRAGFGLGLGLG